MEENTKSKSIDEIVSMILGLVVVALIVLVVVNVFGRIRGNISVPGISDQKPLQVVGNNIPGVSEKTQSGSTYKVNKGDSLWKIAVREYRNGNDWVKIANANNLKNPGVLYAGQELTLPQLSVTGNLAQAQPTVTKKVAASVINRPKAISGSVYTVVKGDSLWKIAVRHYADGYQWSRIWQQNRKMIRNPGLIYAGTKLTLPNISG